MSNVFSSFSVIFEPALLIVAMLFKPLLQTCHGKKLFIYESEKTINCTKNHTPNVHNPDKDNESHTEFCITSFQGGGIQEG